MGIKIELSPGAKKIFGAKKNQSIISDVRKEFSKTAPKQFKRQMLDDMNRGISPVKGEGKWQKYSVSYKQSIKGEAYLDPETGEYIIFRRINGKVRKIQVENKKLTNNSLQEQASPTKRISPVNLRLSGKLHNSLKVFTSGGFIGNFRFNVKFKSFLADIHNRLGAGKSKVLRRLLPTKSGETFNNKLNKVLLTELKKAVDKVAKKNT